MNYTTLDKLISTINGGSIHTLTYTKPLKTRKGVTDSITKTCKTQVMLKVNYDNIKTVKEGRADGTLPAVNAGLPKGTSWSDSRRIYIKNNKTGAIQLRCMKAHGNKTITEYRKNGVIVDKADIEALCLKGECEPSNSPIFNIGIEKIDSLK